MSASSGAPSGASAPERVRVGLVGAGFAAGLHLRAYRACTAPGARVVAIAGAHETRARAAATDSASRTPTTTTGACSTVRT